MGISDQIIKWVKLLFNDTSTTLNLYGSLGENCKIENRVRHHTFLSWDEAQIKFKLTVAENEDWIMLTSKIINK